MSKNKDVTDVLDLASVDEADESHMTVSINGKATSWVWTFAGPGHPNSIAQDNRLARERLERERAQEYARINGKKWKPPEESVDVVVTRNVNLVVDRLLGWTEVHLDGKPFPFTPDNARALLMDPRKGTLLKQAMDFLKDETAFTKRSATS